MSLLRMVWDSTSFHILRDHVDISRFHGISAPRMNVDPEVDLLFSVEKRDPELNAAILLLHLIRRVSLDDHLVDYGVSVFESDI